MDVTLIARRLSRNGAGRSSAKVFGDFGEVEGWVDGGGGCFRPRMRLGDPRGTESLLQKRNTSNER